MQHEIAYGKADVKVYRTHAEPLTGVTQIPESPFAGRENILTAAQIEVVVHGEDFWPAYERGDNRMVVATDTMKNFIHAASLRARATTLELWLHEVGTAFLEKGQYDQAIAHHERSIALRPDYVPGYNNRGAAWVKVSIAKLGILKDVGLVGVSVERKA